jgi:hypothetical protein
LTGRPMPETDLAAVVLKRFAEAIRPQTDLMLPGVTPALRVGAE